MGSAYSGSDESCTSYGFLIIALIAACWDSHGCVFRSIRQAPPRLSTYQLYVRRVGWAIVAMPRHNDQWFSPVTAGHTFCSALSTVPNGNVFLSQCCCDINDFPTDRSVVQAAAKVLPRKGSCCCINEEGRLLESTVILPWGGINRFALQSR
ncbi:hypothetical protein BU23DRAFT_250966 [Bimuria novae-zelandiae CBS 107.79]|uniref:Uncharacterized protein n=1 Tax=Bimuria novae-zelandiae CBS 107.79 TaxID=1447943 RepID=A0A6A5VY54_9PLEO|nr:hypothetical protein BU23DRAFT_250966 [Bimuria novae-zelandiae CBS 107.79]